MNADMRILQLALLALVVVGTLWWQWRLYLQDAQRTFPYRRLYVPLLVAAVVLVGYLGLGLLSLADSRKVGFGFLNVCELLFKALVLGLLLNCKALLGPLFVGYSIGATVYWYFEYRELVLWPGLDGLYHWVFEGVPVISNLAVLLVAFLYAFGTSVLAAWLEPPELPF